MSITKEDILNKIMQDSSKEPLISLCRIHNNSSNDAEYANYAHLHYFNMPSDFISHTTYINEDTYLKLVNTLHTFQVLPVLTVLSKYRKVCVVTNSAFMVFTWSGGLCVLSTTNSHCEMYKKFLPLLIKEKVMCKLSINAYGSVDCSLLNPPRTTSLEYYPYVSHDKIVQTCNGSNPGLILFSGEPGTGKSRYLEHLCSVVNRNVYYMTEKAAIDIISSSKLEELKNSLILIEEGDALVENRTTNSKFNAAFLDTTSGITAETNNITWIITTNLKSNDIDFAIKRKGRLILNQEFRKLTPAEIRKAFPNVHAHKDLTLADCFADEEEVVIPMKKVGFR